MRGVIIGLGMVGMVESAAAADLESLFLRGSDTPTYHWGGVYGGAQVGYSSASVDFGNGVSSLIAFMLRNTTIEADEGISQWTVLGKQVVNGTSLGGFVGYNSEWEDVILGLELNYSRMSLSASATDSISRSFIDNNVGGATLASPPHNYTWGVTVTGTSSVHFTDLATLRARAGWETGNFLPYGFIGLAVARADVSRSASVNAAAVDNVDTTVPATTPYPSTGLNLTQTDGQNGMFAYGGAVGLGVDVALLPNVFVRGEWEYIQFSPIKDLHVSMNSFRTAAGVRF